MCIHLVFLWHILTHRYKLSLPHIHTQTYTYRWHWHMAQRGGSLGNRKLPSQEGPGQLRIWPYWMSSVNLGFPPPPTMSPSFTPQFPSSGGGGGEVNVSQGWANTCQAKVDCLLRIMCRRQVANVPPPFSLRRAPLGDSAIEGGGEWED